jgi:hypothetical protein
MKCYMDEKNITFLIEFLNKGNIVCASLNDLNGMLVPRELFFNETIYKERIKRANS